MHQAHLHGALFVHRVVEMPAWVEYNTAFIAIDVRLSHVRTRIIQRNAQFRKPGPFARMLSCKHIITIKQCQLSPILAATPCLVNNADRILQFSRLPPLSAAEPRGAAPGEKLILCACVVMTVTAHAQ